MSKYIPYERAKNYAHHRCQHAIVKFDKNDFDSDQFAPEDTALHVVSEHLADSQGSWTASWDNRKRELTVYSKDTYILAYIAMLSK